MSDITGYRVGGTIHLIINNQIGFTTGPSTPARSLYCSDVAKTVQAPIFHVNGDDPEACVRVARLAFEYRQTFHKDVVIDMVCYRRHGHNEGDDPSYTQPLMYKAIAERRSVRKLYVEALVKRGDITVEEAEQALADFQSKLQVALDETRAHAPEAVKAPKPPKPRRRAAARRDRCRPGRRSTRSSTTSPTTRRASRRTRSWSASSRPAPSCTTTSGEVDWATAEALAIGSLVLEGTPVRLAGEDTPAGHVQPAPRGARRLRERRRRGSRSTTCPARQANVLGLRLAAVGVRRARLRVRLRPRQPRRAGDVGGAVRRLRQRRPDHHRPVPRRRRGQVGPEQRPRAAAAARLRGPGPRALVGAHRAVPHARAPRTTSRSCNATTAAQYFHLLRRQVHRDVRKPLVLFTPKQPLRMKQSRSPIDELTHRLVPGGARRPGRHRSATPCSGSCSARQGRVGRDGRARPSGRRRPRSCASSSSTRSRPSRCSTCCERYPNASELRVAAGGAREHGRLELRRAPHVAHQGARLRPAPRRRVSSRGSPATGSKTIHDQELADLMTEIFAGL